MALSHQGTCIRRGGEGYRLTATSCAAATVSLLAAAAGLAALATILLVLVLVLVQVALVAVVTGVIGHLYMYVTFFTSSLQCP